MSSMNSPWVAAAYLDATSRRSAGWRGHDGTTAASGRQTSLRKSRQQRTASLAWLKLVPYRTVALTSGDMCRARSANGSSKNRAATSSVPAITSPSTPWFTTWKKP
uniref:Uncharacterized protein n=1 Tax=Arundo donax TaxID=35708 RepID=A0A0A9FDR7_ARUDO